MHYHFLLTVCRLLLVFSLFYWSRSITTLSQIPVTVNSDLNRTRQRSRGRGILQASAPGCRFLSQNNSTFIWFRRGPKYQNIGKLYGCIFIFVILVCKTMQTLICEFPRNFHVLHFWVLTEKKIITQELSRKMANIAHAILLLPAPFGSSLVWYWTAETTQPVGLAGGDRREQEVHRKADRQDGCATSGSFQIPYCVC